MTNDATDGFQLGTFNDFLEQLKNDFRDVDAKADALYKLGTARQDTNTIEIHNMYFNLLIGLSGLNIIDNKEILVDYYQ